eukprot:TRINITY_DN121195_c0_g1_i1.p3 TRINITY_DN121195_c0_g1~~TRINITY_DN121195_c0_g1_i1.p3  ORF type:complete len:358 (+),score=22.62 TRINITY_DN121195_c0_g1_i1:625-1698(+)
MLPGSWSWIILTQTITSSAVQCQSTLTMYLSSMIQNQLRGAIEEYSSALKRNPDHVNAAYARGSCQNKLGDYQKAIEDYKLALSKDEERFQMIFSPYRYHQTNQSHRSTCSCSLFLLDNILTKSSLVTPRMFASSCEGSRQLQIGKKPNNEPCYNSDNSRKQKETNPKFNPPCIPYVKYNENLQEKLDSEFKLDPCPKKRNLSPFLKKMQKDKKPALIEIEQNCDTVSKGLERFLNPLRKSDVCKDKFRKDENLASTQPVSRKDLVCDTGSPLPSRKSSGLDKYTIQGYERFEQHDYKNAIYYLTRAIDTGYISSRTLGYRGMSYFYSGNHQLAFNDILKAIELCPKDPSLYLHKYQ